MYPAALAALMPLIPVMPVSGVVYAPVATSIRYTASASVSLRSTRPVPHAATPLRKPAEGSAARREALGAPTVGIWSVHTLALPGVTCRGAGMCALLKIYVSGQVEK